MDNAKNAAKRRSLELLFLGLVIGFVGVLIWFDQFCKTLAVQNLNPGEIVTGLRLPLVGDVCILTLVWNTGAFLSLGAGNTGWMHVLFMIVIPGIALLGMLVWLLRPLVTVLGNLKTFTIPAELRVGLALFLAGGAGNLIDRIREGKVVDFLNFGIGSLRTGIMNVADLYIAAGLVALVVYYFRHRQKKSGD